jgi:hypothetical protein
LIVELGSSGLFSTHSAEQLVDGLFPPSACRFQLIALICTVAIASTGGALVCALATGRLGLNQAKALAARRTQNPESFDAADDDAFDSLNSTAIDGLSLFDDATFWTDVQLETPAHHGAADLTNYSRRNGSFHVKGGSSAHYNVLSHPSQHGAQVGGADCW